MFRKRKPTTRIFWYSLFINIAFMIFIMLKSISSFVGITPIILIFVMIGFIVVTFIMSVIPSFIISRMGKPINTAIEEFGINGILCDETKRKVKKAHYKLSRNVILVQSLFGILIFIFLSIASFSEQTTFDASYFIFLFLVMESIFIVSGMVQVIIFNLMLFKIKAKLGIKKFDKNDKKFGVTFKIMLLVGTLVLSFLVQMYLQWITVLPRMINEEWFLINETIKSEVLEEIGTVVIVGEELEKDESYVKDIPDDVYQKLIKHKEFLEKRVKYYNEIMEKVEDKKITFEETKFIEKTTRKYFKESEKLQTLEEVFEIGNIIELLLSTAICLIIAFIFTRDLKLQIKAIKIKMDDMLEGEKDLSQRLSIVGIDELAQISDRFNRILDQQEKQMSEIISEVNEIKNSSQETDLSVKSVETLISGIEEKSKSVNKLANKQSNDIKVTEESIMMIVDSIRDINKNVSNQAAFVEESSASIEEMISSIESVSKLANDANRVSQALLDVAKSGSKYISNSTSAMRDIKHASDNVSEIITSISEIAKKTNLLAMNASIEAAHAGNAGKGFAVVAEEIRRLAETSGESAKQIIDEITNMTGLIDNGVSLSEKANESFRKILNDIKNSTEHMQNITNAMKEQNVGANEISKSISGVVDSSEHIKDLADNQKEKSELLNENTEKIVSSANEITTASENQKDAVLNIANTINKLKNNSMSTKEAIDKLIKMTSQYKFGNDKNAVKKPGLLMEETTN